LERRVLTFPSGLARELDLNLFVGLGGGGGLGLIFLVRGREDAKGDRDAGFKVQIGDLLGAKRQSSRSTFRSVERRTRRSLLLLFT
jgi:hypothetical protein